MRLASQKSRRFLRKVRAIYMSTLLRPASRGCMKRHFRKRWGLGLSVKGFRDDLMQTAEYTNAAAPLLDETHTIHERIVGSPAAPAEVRDTVNRIRTTIPDHSEQTSILASGDAARYLGIRPLKLEIDLSTQCNLRCVATYAV